MVLGSESPASRLEWRECKVNSSAYCPVVTRHNTSATLKMDTHVASQGRRVREESTLKNSHTNVLTDEIDGQECFSHSFFPLHNPLPQIESKGSHVLMNHIPFEYERHFSHSALSLYFFFLSFLNVKCDETAAKGLTGMVNPFKHKPRQVTSTKALMLIQSHLH